ncbi:hypothetical protein ASE85_07950 [Sphingobium sp. Leaf26]|nr:hypothetical protein ASE85_07950 [Sphingobium sp. Leaf26]
MPVNIIDYQLFLTIKSLMRLSQMSTSAGLRSLISGIITPSKWWMQERCLRTVTILHLHLPE